MGALILSQIPDPDVASSIAADQLSLVRMYDHIIDRASMVVVPLYRSGFGIPDPDCVVFGRRDHPFRIDVEGYPCDVVGVAFEGEEWS